MFKKIKTRVAGVVAATAISIGAALPAFAVELTMYYPVARRCINENCRWAGR